MEQNLKGEGRKNNQSLKAVCQGKAISFIPKTKYAWLNTISRKGEFLFHM